MEFKILLINRNHEIKTSKEDNEKLLVISQNVMDIQNRKVL